MGRSGMEKQPCIPGLRLPKARGKSRSESERLAVALEQAKKKSFGQLGECFGRFIPGHFLRPSESGALSRRRLFSKENTFWSFFSQVLDADGGCKEAVRKLQAAVVEKGQRLPSSSTAAYCKARQKFELSTLESIHQHLSDQLRHRAGDKLLNGRRIVVVDGTGLSMPDTAENQEPWPQMSSQKPYLHDGVTHYAGVNNERRFFWPLQATASRIFRVSMFNRALTSFVWLRSNESHQSPIGIKAVRLSR